MPEVDPPPMLPEVSRTCSTTRLITLLVGVGALLGLGRGVIGAVLMTGLFFGAARLAVLRFAGLRFAALRVAGRRFAALRLAGRRFAARLAGRRFAALRLADRFFDEDFARRDDDFLELFLEEDLFLAAMLFSFSKCVANALLVRADR